MADDMDVLGMRERTPEAHQALATAASVHALLVSVELERDQLIRDRWEAIAAARAGGMTTREVAGALGLSKGRISQMEKAKRP